MEIALIVIVAVVVLIVIMNNSSSPSFADPKGMNNDKLIGAIAGQADWLEKMSSSPLEAQRSKSIVELSFKRRKYIAQLCGELLTRKSDSSDGVSCFLKRRCLV